MVKGGITSQEAKANMRAMISTLEVLNVCLCTLLPVIIVKETSVTAVSSVYHGVHGVYVFSLLLPI